MCIFLFLGLLLHKTKHDYDDDVTYLHDDVTYLYDDVTC